MKLRIHRPSPALFVAVLALIVAMGGSAVALQRTQSGDSLIAKRTLSGNRLRLNTVTGKEVAEGKLGRVPKANLAAHVPALVWHTLTLINDWTNFYGPERRPAWAIDIQGIVHLRGDITESSGTDPHFATLPAAARPVDQVYLSAMLGAADLGRVTIDPAGQMFVAATSNQANARDLTSLDGITYSLH